MKYTTLLITFCLIAAMQSQAQYQNNLMLSINASTQSATLYRGQTPIQGLEAIPVATGRIGHETPNGTWKIIQTPKTADRSNKYGVNMPYCMRTNATGGGICAHEGPVFFNASSHGCIRIHEDYAKKVFDTIKLEWKSTTITVQGSVKEYIKLKLGNLLDFDKNGYPTGFKRENGRLPDEFLKAVKDGRVTTFVEDKNEQMTMDPTQWYFSLEYWPDRRAKGVSMDEFNDRFSQWIVLSEEQIEKLHRRHQRY
ncbi:MAG TPA: L,D-transpeptidase [Candidatus Paceibacterota bacterium]